MKTTSSKTAFLIVTVMALLGISGCDNSGESNYEEQYVLQGFMPLGHRISVRLAKTIDIDQYYDEAAVGVPGASVTVWESRNGETTEYALVEDSAQISGTYAAPAAEDTVKTGYDYSLRIVINDDTITAVTRQAPPPFRMDSCWTTDTTGSELIPNWNDGEHPPVYTYGTGRYFEMFYEEPVECAGVTMILENLEPDWFSNDDLAVSGNNGPDQSNAWAMSLRTGNSFQVPPILLGYQGLHRVRAMTSDSAAYDYFLSLQPGNAESHPPTNVVGALGLFSVYDADTAYFCLTDPEADVVYQCQP